MNDDAVLKAWFYGEVLPLGPSLTRFLRRKWPNESEIADIRQEVFTRAYLSAREALPVHVKSFVFTIARNYMIDCAKSAHVVSMRHVADLESTLVPPDNLTPDRTLLAREDLRRLQLGLDRLPPRCREVVYLRKVEGLSTREVAERMKVTIDTVEQQTRYGIRALNDFMQGGDGKVRRSSPPVLLRQAAAK